MQNDGNAEGVAGKTRSDGNNTAPESSFAAPYQLNLELTARCPLRCPQCYCDLTHGKDLDPVRATEVLKQAAAIGTSNINLSGGETMVYPHLYELIEACSSLGLRAAVALSGWGVDKKSLQRLIDSGVSEIYVSLNGSTQEVSSLTRDGHDLAIRSLELLSESGFGETAVNWVAHRSNCDDFANVAALCARLRIKSLIVMAFKPDAAHSLESAPDAQQTQALASEIKRLQKEHPGLTIDVETCYSPLRALLGQKFFFNLNVGITRGCGAGRDCASLNIDGKFTPCRHLDFPEDFENLQDYWYNSQTLKKLRTVEKNPEEPCLSCKYGPYCLSCMAVSTKLEGRIAKTNKHCKLWQQGN